MKTEVRALVFLFALLPAMVALAGGDKNQTQNPIFDDGCVEVTPPGIDPENCEEVPAPAQSGMQVFFCEGTRVIICDDDPEAD